MILRAALRSWARFFKPFVDFAFAGSRTFVWTGISMKSPRYEEPRDDARSRAEWGICTPVRPIDKTIQMDQFYCPIGLENRWETRAYDRCWRGNSGLNNFARSEKQRDPRHADRAGRAL